MTKANEPTSNLWLLRLMRMQAVALLAVIALLAVGYARLHHDEQRISAGLTAQTANRARNVMEWCGAINQLDAVLVAYVGGFKDVPPLRLRHLPCSALTHATLASTKPR